MQHFNVKRYNLTHFYSSDTVYRVAVQAQEIVIWFTPCFSNLSFFQVTAQGGLPENPGNVQPPQSFIVKQFQLKLIFHIL